MGPRKADRPTGTADERGNILRRMHYDNVSRPGGTEEMRGCNPGVETLVIAHIFFSFQLGLLLRTSTSTVASRARWFAIQVRRRSCAR